MFCAFKVQGQVSIMDDDIPSLIEWNIKAGLVLAIVLSPGFFIESLLLFLSFSICIFRRSTTFWLSTSLVVFICLMLTTPARAVSTFFCNNSTSCWTCKYHCIPKDKCFKRQHGLTTESNIWEFPCNPSIRVALAVRRCWLTPVCKPR